MNKAKLFTAATVLLLNTFLSGCMLYDSTIDNDTDLSPTRVRVSETEEIGPKCIIAEVKPGDFITYNPITGSSNGC